MKSIGDTNRNTNGHKKKYKQKFKANALYIPIKISLIYNGNYKEIH